MGTLFRKVLKDSWGYNVEENTAYPIIVGKAAKHFKLRFNIKSYLQAVASNLINVCVNIHRTKNLDCTIKIYKIIRDMQNHNEKYSLNDLGGICFNSDIYSIKHENIKTRIYKT